MRTLIELIVSLLIVFGVFTAVVGAIALIINGLNYLPQYIGGFGTFILYVAGFILIFSAINDFTDR